ncbi:MAG: hypothetical protein ACW99U_16200 [Candidatus Thorarchaeota archaeon]
MRKRFTNSKKTGRTIFLGMALAVLTSISMIGPLNAAAAVVFSDDFNDGNYDGWTVTNGAFAIVDNRLESTGGSDVHSSIYFESDITNGTWSFDVKDPDVTIPALTEVDFMAEDNSAAGAGASGTMFAVLFQATRISIFQVYAGTNTFKGDWDTPSVTSPGYHSIDVTLDENGHFDMFVNGTHRLCFTTFIYDEPYGYFNFGSSSGGAIDNVVVQDTIDGSLSVNETCPLLATTTTTTTTDTTTETTTDTTTTDTTTTQEPPPPLPMELIAAGVGIPVVLVIVVILLRSRRG